MSTIAQSPVPNVNTLDEFTAEDGSVYGGACRQCGQAAMLSERIAFRGGLCPDCWHRMREQEEAAWASYEADLRDADLEAYWTRRVS